MLPCQTGCAGYQDGCHKHCPVWSSLQASQKSQREAKKEYLRYHSARCAQTLRQLRAMQPHNRLGW